MLADTLVGAEAMASSLAQRVGNQLQQLSNLKQELKATQVTAPDRTAVFGSTARRMEIMEVELLRLISRCKELEVQEAQVKKRLNKPEGAHASCISRASAACCSQNASAWQMRSTTARSCSQL